MSMARLDKNSWIAILNIQYLKKASARLADGFFLFRRSFPLFYDCLSPHRRGENVC